MCTKLPWNEDWILEHYQEYDSFIKMVDAYNEAFGTKYNRFQMRHHLSINMRLSIGYLYTEEQKAFIEEYYPIMFNDDFTKFYNERFIPHRSLSALRQYANIHDIYKTDAIFNEAQRKKSIKNKGFPVGTIRISRDKYAYIKCSDKKWHPVSHIKYKEYHGEYPPKGYKIVYLNGNSFDYSKENMVAVPRSVVSDINYSLKFDRSNPDLTKTAIAWSQLHLARCARKKYTS